MASIFERIAFHAKIEPRRPAVILADRVVTYEMLAATVGALTERIVALGLPRRALVGVKVENPARHLALLFALERAGLASISFAGRVSETPGLQLAALLLDTIEALRAGVRAVVVDDDWFAPGAASGPDQVSPPAGDEVCRIILSSGTTGVPKPVRLTPDVVAARAEKRLMQLSDGGFERLMCAMNVATAWTFDAALATLGDGKTLMLSNVAEETIDMMALYRADRLTCSTHQLRMLLDLQEQRFTPCDSLRWIDVGGSAVSVALIDRARRLFPARVMVVLGATETGITAYAPAERLPRVDGAIGFALPSVEIEAVDDDDRPRPKGAEGRLRLRGKGQGYWGEFRPGGDAPWFYPGDVGAVRSDGCVVISGRASEIINIGGLKIAPNAIEEVLLSHPDVAEVAAVGVVGADGFEQPWAAVVARRPVDEAALKQFCATRLRDAAPTRVVAVASIPRVGGGKVASAELRETLERLVDAGGAPPAAVQNR